MSEVKPIVTLFEAYGSGATTIAPMVAKRLGVPYMGQKYSSEELEAQKAHTADSDTGAKRFLRSFGISTAGYDSQFDPDPMAALNLRNDYETALNNTKEILAFMQDGGVILGRNGTVVLGNRPEALHVKLTATVEERIARAATEAGIDIERATKRQIYEDRVRAEMSIRLYNWDPREATYFDLVINTAKFSNDAVVEMIVAAQKIKSGQKL